MRHHYAANHYSHPLRSHPQHAAVMQGAIRYLGYADETSPEPVETLTIEAGQFGVFPPEKWHCIEALSEDTVFNVDFYVDPKILIEG